MEPRRIRTGSPSSDVPFRIDTANQCLWRRADTGQEARILLTPKAFAVLAYLVLKECPRDRQTGFRKPPGKVFPDFT